MHYKLPLSLLLLLSLLALTGRSQSAAASESAELETDHLRSILVADRASAQPGGELRLGLLLQHAPGWHTYWKNPGDSGLPTRLRFELPEGVQVGEIEWPLPERQPAGGLVNFGYSDTELLPVALRLPADYPGSQLDIRLSASWLICEVECIPGRGEYLLQLPVTAESGPPSRWRPQFERAAARQPAWLADSDARYSAEQDTVRIQLPLAGAAADALAGDLGAWTLIPATAQLLANADDPRLQREGDALHVEVARSEYFTAAPERIELLLSDGERGFAFEATHDAGLAPLASTAPGATSPQVGLLLALALAFAGGLVLNLMPCVFPVLSIKAMGAIQAADDPAELRRHGLWYTLGVVSSVLAVAALLLALRAGGEAIGWGFQLQEPGFVAAIALLLFAMGLSFSGLYEFGGGLANLGQGLTEGGGRRGAFFTGVLACVVASPCTAPFMGTALGVALVLPTHEALLVFAGLGLGLAFPMLALGYVPALARALPRPGAWMQTFRELLAFPLYLTVLWLVWVFGQQTSMLSVAALGAGLVAVAFGLWLLRQAQGADRARRPLQAIAALSLLAALGLPLLAPVPAGVGGAPAAADHLHEPWTRERFDALRREGRPLLVNMTADWCITCLANERVALSSTEFAEGLRSRDVVYLKGDWTRQDADITAYLESYGRSGVPLYVLYPPRGEPRVLPQLLTPALVRAALEELPTPDAGS